jgi:hypothetical protein
VERQRKTTGLLERLDDRSRASARGRQRQLGKRLIDSVSGDLDR